MTGGGVIVATYIMIAMGFAAGAYPRVESMNPESWRIQKVGASLTAGALWPLFVGIRIGQWVTKE